MARIAENTAEPITPDFGQSYTLAQKLERLKARYAGKDNQLTFYMVHEGSRDADGNRNKPMVDKYGGPAVRRVQGSGQGDTALRDQLIAKGWRVVSEKDAKAAELPNEAKKGRESKTSE